MTAVPLFRVESPGLLTTVQDLGRWGHQRDGMPVAGAMDPFAASVANLLVGNPRGDAVLEITLLGPTVTVLSDVRVALCGGDLSPTLDGQPSHNVEDKDFTRGPDTRLWPTPLRGAGVSGRLRRLLCAARARQPRDLSAGEPRRLRGAAFANRGYSRGPGANPHCPANAACVPRKCRPIPCLPCCASCRGRTSPRFPTRAVLVFFSSTYTLSSAIRPAGLPTERPECRP